MRGTERSRTIAKPVDAWGLRRRGGGGRRRRPAGRTCDAGGRLTGRAVRGRHGNSIAGQGNSLCHCRSLREGRRARGGILREGKDWQESCRQNAGQLHGDEFEVQ